jgi:hypothetical protein
MQNEAPGVTAFRLAMKESRGVLRADTDFDVPDSWPFTHVGYEWVGVGMLIMAAGH